MRVKLQQKATTFIPEDTVLLKAFKYFDLTNSGLVDQRLFFKALEKIGVVVGDPNVQRTSEFPAKTADL